MRYGRLVALLVILSSISLFIGVSNVQLSELLQLNGQSLQILLATRLPRTICLILVGATSSICGLIMQHLTQNKFVSPTTAGTMDSARLGILVAMIFLPGASLIVRSLTAFCFAFAGTLLFLSLTRLFPQKNQLMLPLIGVMLGNIIGSVATFFAYQFQLVQNMTSWLQGNFATVIRGNYELLYAVVPLLFLVWLFAYQFTIIGLGESFAVNLGIDYQKMQFLGIGLVSLASAVMLIMVGSIPFIGVIIPNLVSRIYGDRWNHRWGYLPLSSDKGATICLKKSRLFLLVCLFLFYLLQECT